MRRSSRVAAGLVWLSLAVSIGCSTITSTKKVGRDVPSRKLKPLEGVWRLTGGGDPVSIKHIEKTSELRIAGLVWKGDKFAVKQISVHISHVGNAYYGNVPDGSGKGQFVFCRIVMKKNTVVVFWPKPDVFERAVADGKLSGTTRKSRSHSIITITPKASDLDGFITRNSTSHCFDLESPWVFHRISDSINVEDE